MPINIPVQKLSESAVLPAYQTALSAGMDLTAAIKEPMMLGAHERAVVPTGIAIALPEGYEAQVRGYCRIVAAAFPGRAVRGLLIFGDAHFLEVAGV